MSPVIGLVPVAEDAGRLGTPDRRCLGTSGGFRDRPCSLTTKQAEPQGPDALPHRDGRLCSVNSAPPHVGRPTFCRCACMGAEAALPSAALCWSHWMMSL